MRGLTGWTGILLMAAIAAGLIVFGNSSRLRFLADAPPPVASGTTPADDGSVTRTLAAIGGAAALSGDRVRFGDAVFWVENVTCPDPSTGKGRDAKALANTFLRISGSTTCRWHRTPEGNVGDCSAKTVDGTRRLSQVLLASGHCSR